MKKMISLLLIFVLCLSMCACGASNEVRGESNGVGGESNESKPVLSDSVKEDLFGEWLPRYEDSEFAVKNIRIQEENAIIEVEGVEYHWEYSSERVQGEDLFYDLQVLDENGVALSRETDIGALPVTCSLCYSQNEGIYLLLLWNGRSSAWYDKYNEGTSIETDAYYESVLVGDWNNLYYCLNDIDSAYNVYMSLNTDMSCKYSDKPDEAMTWSVRNGVLIIKGSDGSTKNYNIVDEDGKITIESVDEWNGDEWLFPCEEVDTFLEGMVKVIDLSEVDLNDYAEFYIHRTDELNAFNEYTGTSYLNLGVRSKLFEEGWYYLDSPESVVEILIGEHEKNGSPRKAYSVILEEGLFASTVEFLDILSPQRQIREFDVKITTDQISFGRATGNMIFVHSDYVKELKMSDNGNFRCIVLKDDLKVAQKEWSRLFGELDY